jgi:hypothetical protein
MDFEESGLIPAYELLATCVDVVPTSAAADAEEVTDGGRHVAAAMNSKIPGRAILGDQRADEPLIVFLDGLFTLIARHPDWRGRLGMINDWGIPSFTEEGRPDQQS